jgi:hypothetical protein
MSAFTPVQIAIGIWLVVAIIYGLLFLYRSIVGMKEEDTLYLSAGENRLEAEQREIMKRINRLDPLIRWSGFATLFMTLVLVAMWGYGAYKQF